VIFDVIAQFRLTDDSGHSIQRAIIFSHLLEEESHKLIRVSRIPDWRVRFGEAVPIVTSSAKKAKIAAALKDTRDA
jgi:hypothetical protein